MLTTLCTTHSIALKVFGERYTLEPDRVALYYDVMKTNLAHVFPHLESRESPSFPQGALYLADILPPASKIDAATCFETALRTARSSVYKSSYTSIVTTPFEFLCIARDEIWDSVLAAGSNSNGTPLRYGGRQHVSAMFLAFVSFLFPFQVNGLPFWDYHSSHMGLGTAIADGGGLFYKHTPNMASNANSSGIRQYLAKAPGAGADFSTSAFLYITRSSNFAQLPHITKQTAHESEMSTFASTENGVAVRIVDAKAQTSRVPLSILVASVQNEVSGAHAFTKKMNEVARPQNRNCTAQWLENPSFSTLLSLLFIQVPREPDNNDLICWRTTEKSEVLPAVPTTTMPSISLC